MEETLRIIQQAIPAIETWLRATVNDEVSKALQADREKRQFVKRYTREETCELLGISKTTLWAWTNDGRINAIRIGRKPMYTQEEIDRVLKK